MDLENFEQRHQFINATKIDCTAVERGRLMENPKVSVETPLEDHREFHGFLVVLGDQECVVALTFWTTAYLLITVPATRVKLNIDRRSVK